MSLSFSFDKGVKSSASPKKSSLKPVRSNLTPTAPISVATPVVIELPPAERVSILKEEGNTLAEAGFFVRALQRWEEALILDPSNALLHELRAQVLLEMGEDELALDAASRAVEFAELWSDGHLTLGRVLLNLGMLNEAKESMEKALLLTRRTSDANGRPYGQNSSEMEVERELDEVLNLITIKGQREESSAAKIAILEDTESKTVEEDES